MPFLVLIAIIICGVIYARKAGIISLQQNVDFCFKCRKTNARLERNIMTSYIWDGMTFEEALAATQNDIYRLGFVPCIPPDAYNNDGIRESGIGYERHVEHDGADKQHAYFATSHVSKIDKYDSEAVQNRIQIYINRWKAIHSKEADVNMPEPKAEEIYSDFPTTERRLAQESMRLSQWKCAAPVGSYFMHGFYGTCEVVGYDEPPIGESLCYRVRVLSSGQVVGGIHFDDSTITKIRVQR